MTSYKDTQSGMDRMISKMASMYPIFLLMGLMMVGISFIVGYLNSQTVANYFAEAKAVRELTLMSQRASFESVDQWLPYFKFLGIGFILGGIVMALRKIIDNLRDVGDRVLDNLPDTSRPKTPTPPWYALLMPMLMMLGLIIFLFAFIWSLVLSQQVTALFSNKISAIDTSLALTTDLSLIKQANAWMIPLKFFAIATEFLAITIGLATIIYILTNQTDTLEDAILIGGKTHE